MVVMPLGRKNRAREEFWILKGGPKILPKLGIYSKEEVSQFYQVFSSLPHQNKTHPHNHRRVKGTKAVRKAPGPLKEHQDTLLRAASQNKDVTEHWILEP